MDFSVACFFLLLSLLDQRDGKVRLIFLFLVLFIPLTDSVLKNGPILLSKVVDISSYITTFSETLSESYVMQIRP